VLAFLVDPRSAPHVIAVQTSLLAALGLSDAIFPALAHLGKQTSKENEELFLASKSGRWIFGYLLLMLLVNSMLNVQSLRRLVLSSEDRTAMKWIASATPTDSRFLAMTWRNDPSLTPLLEWFPALSGRTNISTLQGREWLPGKQNFHLRLDAYPALYACLFQGTTCLEQWASQQDDTFDYVYLSLATSAGAPPQHSLLETSLLQSERYLVVYRSPTVLIFTHR